MCETCKQLKKVMEKKANELKEEINDLDPLKDSLRLRYTGGYIEALRFFYSHL